jgi:hypothetical protein
VTRGCHATVCHCLSPAADWGSAATRSFGGGTIGGSDQDSLIPLTVKEISHLFAVLILSAKPQLERLSSYDPP